MKRYRFTDLRTGTHKDYSEEDAVRLTTAASRKQIKKYYDNRQDKEWFKAHNDEQGGFIFAVYKMGEEFNKHEEILTQADLSRLVLLSTYINYEGVLMETQKTVMSKKPMSAILRISERAFRDFYKKLLQLEILMEQEGKILVNEAYFFKGSTKDHKTGIDNCTRIYTNTVRELYNKVPTKSHGMLGLLFRLIPYLNIEYNVVCHNPAEGIADNVKPMTLGELAEKMGYSPDNMDKLTSLKTIDGKQIIRFDHAEDDKRAYKIVVNPKVIYGGTEFKQVEVLTILFK